MPSPGVAYSIKSEFHQVAKLLLIGPRYSEALSLSIIQIQIKPRTEAEYLFEENISAINQNRATYILRQELALKLVAPSFGFQKGGPFRAAYLFKVNTGNTHVRSGIARFKFVPLPKHPIV